MRPRGTEGPLGLELVEGPDQGGPCLFCGSFQEIDITRAPAPPKPLMLRHYAGDGYETMEDHARLDDQHVRIKVAMADGRWRTLQEIHDITGDPENSISAQLRHLRKSGFGSHEVDKRRRGPGRGLWEYQLKINWETERVTRDVKPPTFGRELRDAARRDGIKGRHS